MPTVPELDRFLADLETRRQRLVESAEPSELGAVDLVDELNELSQQLILADEELRVQQQELEETRQSLLALSAERALLLQHSSRAYVVTDEHGVVLQATPAVRQLLGQQQARLTPRPVATWFEVEDRRAVRDMIGRAVATGEPQRRAVRLRSAGAAALPVELLVERAADGGDGRPLLRWEVTPRQPAPGPGQDPVAHADVLALQLATTAVELDACATREELADRVIEATLRLVHGARDAGLVLCGPGGSAAPLGWTSEAVRAVESIQLTTRKGPVARALTATSTVRAGGGSDVAPGSGATAGAVWPGGVLAMPLVVEKRRLGVLTVYGGDAGTLGPDAELAFTALGKHVAVALRRLAEASGLQEAIATRQVVGQAVGILVERHRKTPEAAFAQLVSWSQNRNVKLRLVAQDLVETGQEPPSPPS